MAVYVKFFMRFITVGLLSIQLCAVFSSSLAPTAAEARSSCEDGMYEHNGRYCCRCGLGQRVTRHCNTSLNDGKCQPCEPGSYSSYPNDKDKCTPCTSCSHPSENLEDEESCTSARDATCRCKKDHYCGSNIDKCRLCQRCKVCGPEGIKVPCKGNNNTVCNDQPEGGIQPVIIVCIVLGVISLAVIALYVWKKRPCSKTPPNGRPADVEMQPMRDVDLQPHLPDIAEVIGWKDMQDIAISSRISHTIIDALKLNHPGDSQEQTLQLLRTWTEQQGQEAPEKLIQILQKRGKKSKAERVTEILNNGN